MYINVSYAICKRWCDKHFNSSVVQQLTSIKMFGPIVTVKCALFILQENNCMRVTRRGHTGWTFYFYIKFGVPTRLISMQKSHPGFQTSILKNSPKKYFSFLPLPVLVGRLRILHLKEAGSFFTIVSCYHNLISNFKLQTIVFYICARDLE